MVSSGKGGKGENNRLGLMVFRPTGIGSEGEEERGKGQRQQLFVVLFCRKMAEKIYSKGERAAGERLVVARCGASGCFRRRCWVEGKEVGGKGEFGGATKRGKEERKTTTASRFWW
ncbi:hypothetical protein HAX54_000194 [Datura stramonium]|uniref:Uncharacterized protein n=1 Tax=Datura stramonium TaxID=4076 RepID=A0ABS8WSC9_DATST|nr:hypothetical protein [Datura stramonium]